MTPTKERPILMHARSVCGILDGRKTQTRRVVKPIRGVTPERIATAPSDVVGALSPYGAPGDRLWVRETWKYRGKKASSQAGGEWAHESYVTYRADGAERAVQGEHKGPPQNLPDDRESLEYARAMERYWKRWRPSIHMPRWASRITLEVTGVRVERVQETTDADARAEGIRSPLRWVDANRRAFPALWDETNAHRLDEYGWDANPWVWVVEFRRIEP